jgi:hypothetical protein
MAIYPYLDKNVLFTQATKAAVERMSTTHLSLSVVSLAALAILKLFA